MRRIAFYFFILAVCPVLAGCGRQDPNQPPKIRYGEEACSECRMIIAETRFAAAFVSENGDTFKFDDIGCMRRFKEIHPSVSGRRWVHDFISERWIGEKNAYVVHSKDLATPMGYGLAAFSNREDAERFVEKEKKEGSRNEARV